MKILLVHNFYGSTAPSGENKEFEAERQLLLERGETVEVFTRHSDEIRIVVSGCWLWGRFRGLVNLVKGALCTIGNPFAARALARKIRAFKPDVVHFHNTFPLISPLAVRAAKRSGARVVMTLHNYRLVCAAGIPMRGGRVCRDCFACGAQGTVHTTILPALRNRCYRGILTATLPLAINIWLYRRRWAKWVDRFIVLSDFQKRVMMECGLPEEKIVVKGNFVDAPSGVDGGGAVGEKKNQIVYVGRLSREKGVATLIRAFGRLCGGGAVCGGAERVSADGDGTPSLPLGCGGTSAGEMNLILIGDGIVRAELEELAQGLPVVFAGQQSHEAVLAVMAAAKATVLPSECWETFGLTVAESMAVGTPVVVSDLGALPDFVAGGACGEVFEAGNVDALAQTIERLLTREDYREVCAACRRRMAERYSAAANYGQLMAIYRGEADWGAMGRARQNLDGRIGARWDAPDRTWMGGVGRDGTRLTELGWVILGYESFVGLFFA